MSETSPASNERESAAVSELKRRVHDVIAHAIVPDSIDKGVMEAVGVAVLHTESNRKLWQRVGAVVRSKYPSEEAFRVHQTFWLGFIKSLFPPEEQFFITSPIPKTKTPETDEFKRKRNAVNSKASQYLKRIREYAFVQLSFVGEPIKTVKPRASTEAKAGAGGGSPREGEEDADSDSDIVVAKSKKVTDKDKKKDKPTKTTPASAKIDISRYKDDMAKCADDSDGESAGTFTELIGEAVDCITPVKTTMTTHDTDWETGTDTDTESIPVVKDDAIVVADTGVGVSADVQTQHGAMVVATGKARQRLTLLADTIDEALCTGGLTTEQLLDGMRKASDVAREVIAMLS